MLAGRKDQRRISGHRGQEVEPGRMRGLIGRQRQALAMGQLTNVDLDRGAQMVFSAGGFSRLVCRLSAMRATSAAATFSLVMTGQESTSMSSPLRDNKCTVLRS